MRHDPGALHSALAAAVGEDATLIAELRGAFLSSAAAQLATLAASRDSAAWQGAAWRLQGLAASFGAIELMALAQAASEGPLGDPAALRRLRSALATLGG